VALILGVASAVGVACSSGDTTIGGFDDADVGQTSRDPEFPSGDALVEAPTEAIAPVERTGSALARSADGDALFLADEDHAVLRRIPLPLPEVDGQIDSLDLPGRPAQAIALRESVLVTLRDPGALVVVDARTKALSIVRTIPVAADAWGLAVTEDEKTALVTSSWTHTVTAIDLASGQVRWVVDVAREPRGVVLTRSGDAYVSHLTSRELTWLPHADGTSPPEVHVVDLPTGRLRAPRNTSLEATLGYALVLSPDDARLFAPRHALGAQALESWFGTASVDVMLTKDRTPLAPKRADVEARDVEEGSMDALFNGAFDVTGVSVLTMPRLVQPRAAVYRRGANTLLVAGEGSNTVVELDARAIDPTLSPLRTWDLGEREPARTDVEWRDPYARPLVSGGAPTAIALDTNERFAYVYCRTTNEIVPIALESERTEAATPERLRIADDALSFEAARGRRIFFDATDDVVSGGLGCAGCHPDGRDDGHVWHEIDGQIGFGFRARPTTMRMGTMSAGVPRQTPMLAGRVASYGPYGWKAESPMLEDRVRESFSLHRWLGGSASPTMDRPKLLVAYLREGLVPPPRETRPLTDEEARGKAVFEDARVGCATCHVPKYEFTDRVAYDLPRSLRQREFDDEKGRSFRTPSLLFVDGTAPYFHDGKAKTLEQALFENGNAMGKTSHLGAEDRSALLAYVRTL